MSYSMMGGTPTPQNQQTAGMSPQMVALLQHLAQQQSAAAMPQQAPVQQATMQGAPSMASMVGAGVPPAAASGQASAPYQASPQMMHLLQMLKGNPNGGFQMNPDGSWAPNTPSPPLPSGVPMS